MPFATCRNTVVLACLAGTCVAYGQRFSYGVKGGVSVTDPDRINPDESKRYVIGGTVEYRLWGGFAAEADFLYRRNGYSFAYSYILSSPNGEGAAPPSIVNRSRLNIFELPVLGKYYFRKDTNVQPFVLTGYSFRKALEHDNSSVTTQGTIVQGKSSYWTPLDIGASFGAGLRWRAGRVALSPEIRYTEWGSSLNRGVPKRQASVLFGITF